MKRPVRPDEGAKDPWERRDNTLLIQGVRVGKKFELIRSLGNGGMGKVWLALHVGLQRRVALKVLHKAIHEVDHHRERFEREAKVFGLLRHPGIVEALDFGELEDGRKFLAMEHVEGRTLNDILKEQGRLPWRVVTRLGAEVADALVFAHSHGVIHRDLKPDNLIVEGGDPSVGHVRLLDLGLAHVVGETNERTFAVGTAAYSAPEQLRGEPIDPRADVHGLGAVLYHLLSGKAPRSENNDAPIVPLSQAHPDPSRPPALDSLITKMLAAAPGDRPASMEDVRAALRGMTVSLIPPPPPAPSAPVVVAAPRRFSLRTIAWVVLGVLLGVIATLVLTRT